jgi:hypothetical protein
VNTPAGPYLSSYSSLAGNLMNMKRVLGTTEELILGLA